MAGTTQMIDGLNAMIARGNGFYNGGKGLIVRDMLDLGLQKDPSKKVVPSTFWVNDIESLSQMYVDLDGTLHRGILNPFDMVSVGIVIGSQMSKLFPDWDNVQEEWWNQGVFYAHDSNSVDIRCRYVPDKDGYDCPHGWISNHGLGKGIFVPDLKHKGPGSWSMGNPELDASTGGGTGCHFDPMTKHLNYKNKTAGGTPYLMNDANCKCNQAFKSDWSRWVDAWLTIKMPARHWFEPEAWFSQWGDQAMCWHNNIRDMIAHQNAMFRKRTMWSEGVILGFLPEYPERLYEGWNEVPTDRDIIGNPEMWDALILKLPANICGHGGADDSLNCLGMRAKHRLEAKFKEYQGAGYLVPGRDHLDKKPGSYVTVAREVQIWGRWERQFFCEPWTSPSGRWSVMYEPGYPGACYVNRPVFDDESMVV